MVTVEAKVNRMYKKFNFDVNSFIKQGCGIIRDDIQQGLEDGVDVNGVAFKALSPETVKRKSKPHWIDNPKELAVRSGSRMLNEVQRKSIASGASSFNKKSGNKSQLTKKGMRQIDKQQARYISQRPSSPLLDGGNLLRNQKIELAENEGIIRIGVQRAEIGSILQNQGGRKFFGISKIAEDKIHTLLAKRWKEAFEITRAK